MNICSEIGDANVFSLENENMLKNLYGFHVSVYVLCILGKGSDTWKNKSSAVEYSNLLDFNLHGGFQHFI